AYVGTGAGESLIVDEGVGEGKAAWRIGAILDHAQPSRRLELAADALGRQADYSRQKVDVELASDHGRRREHAPARVGQRLDSPAGVLPVALRGGGSPVNQ